MAKVPTQTINGKAFEYALLNDFLERLQSKTTVTVIDNDPYQTAKRCFESLKESLLQAIKDEDYELASELRDEIKRFEEEEKRLDQ